MKKIFFVFPCLVLLAAACTSQPQTNTQSPPVAQTTPEATPTPPAVIPAPPVAIKGTVYENNYLKITIPSGWTVKIPNRTVSFTPCSATGCQTKIQPDPKSLNVIKGNYILFVNARAEQASGVEGGRFEEYAGGAPSVEALIIDHPGGPCGTGENTTIAANGQQIQRTDYYVSAKDQQGDCRKISGNKTLWYFSDVGHGINYFNIPNFSGAVGWVATMAYNSSNISSFPEKNSAGLVNALSEMSDIVSTLVIKAPVPYTPAGSAEISGMANTYWTSQFEEALNGGVMGCLDVNGTSKVSPSSVQTNLHMESLGPDGKVLYSPADVESRITTIDGLLISAGWSKCNQLTIRDGTVSVFQKGNEFVDVEKDTYSPATPDIFITFYKLK